MTSLKNKSSAVTSISPTVKRDGQDVGKLAGDGTVQPVGAPQASIMVKKTKAPFTTPDEFLAAAKFLDVKLGEGASLPAMPKLFSTGSYGFNANGKVTVMVDGKAVTLQCSINLVVVGSKP